MAAGISWRWGGWSEVSVRILRPSGLGLPEEELRTLSPEEEPTLKWEKLALASRLELTPHREGGEPGGTSSFLRPVSVPLLRCQFRDAVRDRQSGIQVTIAPGQQRPGGPLALTLVALDLIAHGRFKAAASAPMKGSASYLALPAFRGLVCVILRGAGRLWLADCTTYSPGEPPGTPNDEERRLAASTLGIPESVPVGGGPSSAAWPDRSRRRFDALVERAKNLRLREVTSLVDLFPRGAFRAIVLRLVDPTWPIWTREKLELLDQPEGVEAALRLELNALPDVLRQLNSADERLWALKNRRSAHLPEIVRWIYTTKSRGGSTLSWAAEHYQKRRRLEKILAEVVEECEAAKTARAWRARLDAAMAGRENLPELDFALTQLEHDVAEAARVSAADGSPPIGKVARFRWEEAIDARREWHGRIDQVLCYCETGNWLDQLRLPETFDLAVAAQRTHALPRLQPTWASAASPEWQNLEAAARMLVKGENAEPPSSEKKQILDLLQSKVIPSCRDWAGLHATLRAGNATMQEFPELGEAFGLGRPLVVNQLETRAALANQAIGLIAELPVMLPRIRSLARDERERREILTRKGSRYLAAVLREAGSLRLALREHSNCPPPVELPPLEPELADPQACRIWWDMLTAFADELQGLKRLQKRMDFLKPEPREQHA